MNGLLVGRDAECAALSAALPAGRCAAHAGRPASWPPGQARLVLVAGEAGAGKTTLVEHVLATAAGRVLRGRAAAWATRPYEVFASALRPASPPGIAPSFGIASGR